MGKRQHEFDPKEEALKGIQLTIFHLGDKHPTLSPEEDLDATLKMILEERKEFTPEIISSITACILELPHKLENYVKLLIKLNREDAVLTGKVLVDFADTLNRSIAVGNWRHLVQGVRAIVDLEANGIVAAESVNQLYNILTTLATSSVFVRWLCLATLGFTRQPAFLMGKLDTSNIDDIHDLNDLIRINEELATSNWAGLGPQTEPNPNAFQLIPLDFSGLVVDPMWDWAFQHLTIFPDAFDEGNAALKLKQWWTILNCRMVMETFEFNHPKLAEALLAVPSEAVGHPEKIVAEFLFGELIRRRRNGLRQVLYEITLMDCCRITRLFPPVMARALLAIVQRLDSIDAVQRDALASWFAHHLSNFDFKWKWDEWQDVLEMPLLAPKRLFVQSVLEKLIRLSYYERVKECLPEWALPLLPPVPEYRDLYEDASDSSLPKSVLEAIHTRAPADDIMGLLAKPSQETRSVFLNTLLVAGSKTLSHAVILIERYLPVLQFLHPKGDLQARLETISIVYDFWQGSVQHFEFIIERLIHYRILTCQSAIQWILASVVEKLNAGAPFDRVALTILQWPLLQGIVAQANGFPATIKAKMSECPTDDQAQLTKLEHTYDALVKESDELYDAVKTGLFNLSAGIAVSPEAQAAVSAICNAYDDHIQI